MRPVKTVLRRGSGTQENDGGGESMYDKFDIL
jgi:hypothetical protein